VNFTHGDLLGLRFKQEIENSDIVIKRIRKRTKKPQPSRDEPEDAPSFTRRLKNSARPLSDPLSRRLEYPPIQE